MVPRAGLPAGGGRQLPRPAGLPAGEGEDGTDVEKFTFADFSRDFAWSKVNTVGPIFDLKKLDWLNRQYIRDLDVDDLAGRLLPYLQTAGVLGENPSLGELARLRSITELISTRMALLSEAPALVAPFYVADDELEIAQDARDGLKDDAPAVLDAAITALEGLHVPDRVLSAEAREGNQWHAEQIEAALRAAIVEGWGSSRAWPSARCAPPCRVSGSARRSSSRWRSSVSPRPWRVCVGCGPSSAERDLGRAAFLASIIPRCAARA